MSSQRVATSRWYWRNWPVLVKLVAAGLVPTLVALVIGVLQIVDHAATAPAFGRISQIVGVQQKLSELIDAVGRERDLATEFVANGRPGDGSALELQFRTVDSRGAAVRTAAEQVEDLEPTGYATVLDQLRGLRPLRQSVLTGTGPAEVVVTEYGAVIDPLIVLDAALVRQLVVNDAVVGDVAVGAAAAAHALLAVREQMSRQHAIVLAALITDRISAPEISEVQAAAVRLDAAQDQFESALDPAQRVGYVSRVVGDAERSRQRLLQLVLDRGLARSALDIAPTDWDERTVVAVEDVAGVENELRQQPIQSAQALRDDVRAEAGRNAVILFLALALGLVVAVLMARSMLRPLGVLRRTALDVAERQLPAAMVRVREGDLPDNVIAVIKPVAVSTREEIGQVARAFDELHRQAVRLAGEQVLLRAHVNDIFVNLARRSQGLVERQLQVIDRLEGGELDPQQLENLFQLDHLATRMRRNSDNLLILAGTDAGKRSSRPVRLVDVLRAAVSEVEQYQRLVLQQSPGVLVLGRAAGDLVHLLAELVDNATQFSPPDTPVHLRADCLADGSVQIEVIDRGVGMTEPELVEANERLVSTPVADASVSRRMGLFVVGRLAARHEIRVGLRRGSDGIGIGACVTMPPRLVRLASETGSGPPGVTVIPREYPVGEYPVGMDGYVTNGNGVGKVPGRALGRTLVQAGSTPPTALQRSTPIFDDVASAWFQERRGVPVQWQAESSSTEPAAGAPTGGSAHAAANGMPGARGTAAVNGTAGARGTAAANGTAAAGGGRADWGSADDRWRAAQARASLVHDPANAPASAPTKVEVTASGLPRRTPRALLVPGTADAVEPAESRSAPARSAEVIRGRLSSYQQGIREGRRSRHELGSDANGFVQHQEAEEETT
ncbi:MAG: nitrate- and nitrite sensing domain-containing protein [Pseudonocardiales bacterium]